MSVIEFKRPEVVEPHITGMAVCQSCEHEWMATAPIGVALFYCPVCKTHKGHMKYDCVPGDGSIWQCGCGCDLFRIDQGGAMCINCGKRQLF